MSRSKITNLSIVVPLFNEEEVFPLLLKELQSVCKQMGIGHEIIFVDDGSTDNTFHLIEEAVRSDTSIKAIKFSRNFGHQAAFSAGMDFASGDIVVTMDGDLQHPPQLIPEFLKHARDGFDIVIGERLQNKQNPKHRELGGKIFYKFLSLITNLEFKNASDFALYNKPVVSTLRRLPEKERFLRGLVQWVGFRKRYLPYVVEERRAGIPKYNVRRLTKLVMSGVTSFSAFPLRLSLWLGLLIFLGCIGFGGYVVWDHYVNPNPLITGWATLVLLTLFIGSVQLIVLGVVGEYLYKMFNEIKGRPLYIVSDVLNIKKAEIRETPYGIHGFKQS